VNSSLSTTQRKWSLQDTKAATQQDQRHIYVVIRANASNELLLIIQESLLKEGYHAEFSNIVYNQQKLLTGIRMVVSQGDQIIGEIVNTNQVLEQPLVFYSINGKKWGLSRGYPKGLPAAAKKKIIPLNGFLVTNGRNTEVHGNINMNK
jgi:hypothetical protein